MSRLVRLDVWFLTLSAALAASAARADVKLPAIISDHMVLQADKGAPIWGWADAGEEVSVTLGSQSQATKAAADGKWMVKFDKLKTSAQPQTLAVRGKNTLTVNDVLVGEVWLGSGQSNMAMAVRSSMNYEQEQAAAKLPQVRMFTVERSSQPTPQFDCKGKWELTTPETVGQFSATLYFFGRDLYNELKVPTGLINSSWGGTAIEAWISLDAQSKLAEYPIIAEAWTTADAQPWDQAKMDAIYQQQLAKWKETAKQAKAAGKSAPRAPRPPVEPRLQQNHPANLYNGMISSILPYGIRGAVWYQGEGNSAKPFNYLYGLQLRTLINDWRTRWGDDFAFAWVQLPDYRAPQKEPVEPSTWAIIREQMLNTLSVPNTGMAITLGLGEENDIHPKNKQGVGQRLALWALAKVYGRDGAASGPLPAHSRVHGSEIIVNFRDADEGLKAKDGKLRGFAIAGADKKFVWADARIDGSSVIVSSDMVPQPVAVRYAWADNPVWSLENADGLPATPFRTDDWKP
ncbi:MAG TPA: sialate O-acetylesterase [Pirellulales bacterium]|nr:sialate O-acetylesterase [Pirellulales bacterium]